MSITDEWLAKGLVDRVERSTTSEIVTLGLVRSEKRIQRQIAVTLIDAAKIDIIEHTYHVMLDELLR